MIAGSSRGSRGRSDTDRTSSEHAPAAASDHDARPSPSEAIERIHALIAEARTQDALDLARDLSLHHPHSVSVQSTLGHALLAVKSPEPALQAFSRALDLQADHVPSLIGHARAARKLGLADDAVDSLEIAITHDPGALEALLELAALYEEAEAWRRAVVLLQSAVHIEPRNADAWVRLASAHDGCEAFDAAAAALKQALSIDAKSVAARVNLGMLNLERLGNAPEAERLFREALSLDPRCYAALANLGLAIQEQGRFEKALALYEYATGLAPRYAEFRWNRGIAHLLNGNYSEGWIDYEARFELDGGRSRRDFPFPRWDGDPRIDGALLVYAEQGLGDEIMFASCVPDLVSRGVEVVLECNPRLESLFRRSFPAIAVRGQPRGNDRAWLTDHPRLSRQAPIGTLARWLRADANQFPRHRGYLQADPQRVAHWKHRLDALGDRVKVGVAWRGGTAKTRRSLKSIDVRMLMPLLNVPDINYVCLQHDLRDEERALLAAQESRIAVWPDALKDLDETAALSLAVDLTISVAATTAHLAGALGAPVWILLPASAEWRWRWTGESTPWYPSARLWRQRRPGDWQGVIAEVCEGLRLLRRPGDRG